MMVVVMVLQEGKAWTVGRAKEGSLFIEIRACGCSGDLTGLVE